MLKKNNFYQAESKTLEYQTQTQTSYQKKYSKAYYKLLHTYNTLTNPTKSQPIFINNCQTPIIAKRLFGCKLNQKQEINHQIQNFIKDQQMKRNLTDQQNQKDKNLRKQIQQQLIQQVDEDDGFQIGDKDQLDQVVQIGMKYVGGWMKGLMPGLTNNKNNNKK